jgi:isoleucyl-tRNA synthetase
VLTHGWTLDAQGKAMHKSLGNAVAPEEVIKESGAEIIRLWCVSSNYFEDMRCSKEILQRVTDGYRKLRNTVRFALGNLDGFDPARDSMPESELEEIDRWALLELDEVVRKVRAAYDTYEFHLVYHTLYEFCTVTLSARYFDIIKDRLYTFAPRNRARRSAQTVLYGIADALARMLAPVLVFTADEIWENLPSNSGDERSASVHMSTFPAASGHDDSALAANWKRVFEVRDQVLGALEEARIAKVIGSSLEAAVALTTNAATYELLKRYESELRYIFIVSQVTLKKAEDDSADVKVAVTRAQGQKCERCWNYSTQVGVSARFPTVCERCVAALEEIEAEAQLS